MPLTVHGTIRVKLSACVLRDSGDQWSTNLKNMSTDSQPSVGQYLGRVSPEMLVEYLTNRFHFAVRLYSDDVKM